jgi:hypothetical protein
MGATRNRMDMIDLGITGEPIHLALDVVPPLQLANALQLALPVLRRVAHQRRDRLST